MGSVVEPLSTSSSKVAAHVCSVLVLALLLAAPTTGAQSLYRSGMVRDGVNLRASLDPPEQTGGEFWRVEQDVDLYHFSEGNGPDVLVIHGGPGYPQPGPWPGLTALAGEFEFHYYHQRGCGRSTKLIDRLDSPNYVQNMRELEQSLGLGAQIADIERIRRILGDEELLIVGHSFGAFLAALYAAEFPERVRAMALVAPAAVLVIPPPDGGLFTWVKEKLPEKAQTDYGRFLGEYFNFGAIFAKTESDLVDLNRRFVSFYAMASGMTDSVAAATTDIDGIGGWVSHACFFSMGMQCDYRPALKTLSVPSLVIHAASDLQPEKASRMYVEALQGAELAVMEAGHFSFAEKPAAFAELVGSFLRSHREREETTD